MVAGNARSNASEWRRKLDKCIRVCVDEFRFVFLVRLESTANDGKPRHCLMRPEHIVRLEVKSVQRVVKRERAPAQEPCTRRATSLIHVDINVLRATDADTVERVSFVDTEEQPSATDVRAYAEKRIARINDIWLKKGAKTKTPRTAWTAGLPSHIV